jgi:hypothetical protein
MLRFFVAKPFNTLYFYFSKTCNMKHFIATLLLLASFHIAAAQNDPEFQKEFILHLKFHSGMVTNFRSSAKDVYVGGFQLVPQYTIVQHLIRAGIIADGLYTGKKLQAAFGPTASIKIKTLYAKPFGSAGNIFINVDHLWGTQHQRLFGGGINADLANKIVIGISAHRDYHLNTWWLQSTLGFRISKLKKETELFNK